MTVPSIRLSSTLAVATLAVVTVAPAALAAPPAARPAPPVHFTAVETAILARGGASCDALLRSKGFPPYMCNVPTRWGFSVRIAAERAVAGDRCLLVKAETGPSFPWPRVPAATLVANVVGCRG